VFHEETERAITISLHRSIFGVVWPGQELSPSAGSGLFTFCMSRTICRLPSIRPFLHSPYHVRLASNRARQGVHFARSTIKRLESQLNVRVWAHQTFFYRRARLRPGQDWGQSAGPTRLRAQRGPAREGDSRLGTGIWLVSCFIPASMTDRMPAP
jgi:hypothetical protein